MTPALLSTTVLLVTLALFVWGRVRHDLVALIALGACLLFGLVRPDEALLGLADPAVVVVAAVLIIGRAVELTGVAAAGTERLTRIDAPFSVKLGILLVAGAALSAFMNNIAALAITMPAVAHICRSAKLPPSAGLMPLAFATILGGMTTLIGTPANLILSSVRADQLGAPFGFFSMTPVGLTVALAGLLYLVVFGWRLTPRRKAAATESFGRNVFELRAEPGLSLEVTTAKLREAGARIIGVSRRHERVGLSRAGDLGAHDRLVIFSRSDPWQVAAKAGLALDAEPSGADGAVTARVVVGHGSPLIGRPHATVAAETDDELQVVAAGPRAATEARPLGMLRIQAGDQLLINGPAQALNSYLRYGRLLEVHRTAAARVSPARSVAALSIYGLAVAAAVAFGLPTALSFGAAAAALAALNFLPPKEIYSSIDWPAVVLLAAMIPVGQSFQATGAAQIAADHLSALLGGSPLVLAAAAMAAATLLLSIFLNNVATAVIMGPIAIDVAAKLGVAPDALLLAVLIGASSDFLTPIGHQNNLLVMGAGGYRFSDYARVGAAMSAIVVTTAAVMIALFHG